VVRERSAKPLCVGSIPTRASKVLTWFQLVRASSPSVPLVHPSFVRSGSRLQAIQYAARVVGVEHVALGCDFDGATTMPFDVTGVPLTTDELRVAGLSEHDIALIMGGNVVRVLSQSLTSGTNPANEQSGM
jgi:hypothetical protein